MYTVPTTAISTDSSLIYPSPFTQIGDDVSKTYNTFLSLLNPHSDIGLSKLSGPVGIVRVFHMASQADIRLVLWFTILINVNRARKAEHSVLFAPLH